MVKTLPTNSRLKLQQTLAQWRQWRCPQPLSSAPEVVRQLGGGLSNHSLLVAATADQHFVVRLDGVNPAAHGLNRQGEWRALGSARHLDLAPGPCYFNPELGSLVVEYLPPDSRQPTSLADIANLLRGIHSLPAVHHKLDLQQRLLRYENQVNPDKLSALQIPREQIMQLLEDTLAGTGQLCLCHNDLLRANRLYSGGKLRALDWEYCAMGDPLYDLATVAAGDELDEEATAALLSEYLGAQPDADQRRRTSCYCSVYRYLELLWYLCPSTPAVTGEFLQRKAAALRASLLAIARC